MAETTTPGPNYYQRGSIQVWEFIRDQRLDFHLGNAIKYICRYGHKGDYNDQLSDLNKAIHYLENERNYLQASRNREDLPGRSFDHIHFSSEAVSGCLQDSELEFSTDTYPAAEPYYGGIQGIFGSGSVTFSGQPSVPTGLS